MKGFIDFIRERGVVAFAIGVIVGGGVSNVVTALVNDIINPVVGLVLGRASTLKEASWIIGSSEILYGDMLSVLLNFLIVAFVVYYGVKLLRLDKIDKKKE